VVVHWVKGNRVLIADPALGRRSLSSGSLKAGQVRPALEPTAQLAAAKTEKLSESLWGCSGLIVCTGQIILASVLLQVLA